MGYLTMCLVSIMSKQDWQKFVYEVHEFSNPTIYTKVSRIKQITKCRACNFHYLPNCMLLSCITGFLTGICTLDVCPIDSTSDVAAGYSFVLALGRS
jgi:hypothetical protein